MPKPLLPGFLGAFAALAATNSEFTRYMPKPLKHYSRNSCIGKPSYKHVYKGFDTKAHRHKHVLINKMR